MTSFITNPTSDKLAESMKAAQKPIDAPNWLVKQITGEKMKISQASTLVNKWMITSGAYRLWKIRRKVKRQMRRMKIWVGDTGCTTKHVQLKPLETLGILKGKSYHGERWDLDGNGHGTHVLSNIASYNNLKWVVRNNMMVLSPVPWKHIKEIKACKILTDAGNGTFVWLRDLLKDALVERPHIINLSLSGPREFADTSLGQEINMLIDEVSKFCIVGCAAGNNGLWGGIKGAVRYPGMHHKAISVANWKDLKNRHWSSAHSDELDYAFFGVAQAGASNTDPNGYKIKTGTSMAIPAWNACTSMFLGGMWNMGMSEELSIEFIRSYIRSRRVLLDVGVPGNDPFAGEGAIFIDEDVDLRSLYTPDDDANFVDYDDDDL